MRMRLLTAMLGLAASAAAGAQDLKPDTYYTETFNRCMTAAGGSTLPMRDCQSAELGQWDGWLNQVYRTLMASRSPSVPSKSAWW